MKRFLLVFLSFTSLLFSQELSPELLEQAKRYREVGRNAEAIRLLQESILKNPYYDDAKVYLADLYYEEGNWAQALQNISDVVLNSSSPLSLYTLRAKIELANMNYPEADVIINQLKATFSNREEDLLLEALSYTLKDNLKTAKEIFQGVLPNSSNDVQILDALVIIALLQQNYDEMRGYLTTLENRAPYDFLTNRFLGSYYMYQNDFPQAIQYFELLQDTPQYRKYVSRTLADLYLADGNIYKSRELYLDEVASSADSREAYNGFIQTFLNDDPSEIVALLELRLEENPHDEEYRWWYQYTVRRIADFGDPLRKKVADYHIGRAEDFEARNESSNAVQEMRIAKQIAPQNREVERRYAEVLLKAGMEDTALALWNNLEKKGEKVPTEITLLRWYRKEQRAASFSWLTEDLKPNQEPSFQTGISLYSAPPRGGEDVSLYLAKIQDSLSLNNVFQLENYYVTKVLPFTQRDEKMALEKAKADGSDILIWVTPKIDETKVLYEVSLLGVRSTRTLRRGVFGARRDEHFTLLKRMKTWIEESIPTPVRVVKTTDEGVVINQGRRDGVASSILFFPLSSPKGATHADLFELFGVEHQQKIAMVRQGTVPTARWKSKDIAEDYTLFVPPPDQLPLIQEIANQSQTMDQWALLVHPQVLNDNQDNFNPTIWDYPDLLKEMLLLY